MRYMRQVSLGAELCECKQLTIERLTTGSVTCVQRLLHESATNATLVRHGLWNSRSIQIFETNMVDS